MRKPQKTKHTFDYLDVEPDDNTEDLDSILNDIGYESVKNRRRKHNYEEESEEF